MSSASSRKEPSMDEILASIRRIIESGDEPAGRKQPDAERVAATPLREAEPAPVPTALPRFDIHYVTHDDETEAASDEELREIEATDFAGSYTEYARSDSEDDGTDGAETVEAEFVEAMEAEPHGRSIGLVADSVPPPAGNENAVLAEEDDVASSDRSTTARSFAFEFDDDAFEAALRSDEALHPVEEARAAAEPVPSAPVASVPAQAPMPESVIEGASALLSAQAGDQVAAAFDDLTRAIREGQMHSMEGMAREMLRPMLQEWLDDNLPRLVERLVRDEIERIARGPRR